MLIVERCSAKLNIIAHYMKNKKRLGYRSTLVSACSSNVNQCFDQNVAAGSSEFLHLCFLSTLVSYRLDGSFSFPTDITIQHVLLLTINGEQLTGWLLWSQG